MSQEESERIKGMQERMQTDVNDEMIQEIAKNAVAKLNEEIENDRIKQIVRKAGVAAANDLMAIKDHFRAMGQEAAENLMAQRVDEKVHQRLEAARGVAKQINQKINIDEAIKKAQAQIEEKERIQKEIVSRGTKRDIRQTDKRGRAKQGRAKIQAVSTELVVSGEGAGAGAGDGDAGDGEVLMLEGQIIGAKRDEPEEGFEGSSMQRNKIFRATKRTAQEGDVLQIAQDLDEAQELKLEKTELAKIRRDYKGDVRAKIIKRIKKRNEALKNLRQHARDLILKARREKVAISQQDLAQIEQEESKIHQTANADVAAISQDDIAKQIKSGVTHTPGGPTDAGAGAIVAVDQGAVKVESSPGAGAGAGAGATQFPGATALGGGGTPFDPNDPATRATNAAALGRDFGGGVGGNLPAPPAPPFAFGGSAAPPFAFGGSPAPVVTPPSTPAVGASPAAPVAPAAPAIGPEVPMAGDADDVQLVDQNLKHVPAQAPAAEGVQEEKVGEEGQPEGSPGGGGGGIDGIGTGDVGGESGGNGADGRDDLLSPDEAKTLVRENFHWATKDTRYLDRAERGKIGYGTVADVQSIQPFGIGVGVNPVKDTTDKSVFKQTDGRFEPFRGQHEIVRQEDPKQQDGKGPGEDIAPVAEKPFAKIDGQIVWLPYYGRTVKFFFTARDFEELVANVVMDGEQLKLKAPDPGVIKAMQSTVDAVRKSLRESYDLPQIRIRHESLTTRYAEWLELKQIMKAIAKYQKTTSGMYNMPGLFSGNLREAVSKAIEEAVGMSGKKRQLGRGLEGSRAVQTGPESSDARPDFQPFNPFQVKERELKRVRTTLPIMI